MSNQCAAGHICGGGHPEQRLGHNGVPKPPLLRRYLNSHNKRYDFAPRPFEGSRHVSQATESDHGKDGALSHTKGPQQSPLSRPPLIEQQAEEDPVPTIAHIPDVSIVAAAFAAAKAGITAAAADSPAGATFPPHPEASDTANGSHSTKGAAESSETFTASPGVVPTPLQQPHSGAGTANPSAAAEKTAPERAQSEASWPAVNPRPGPPAWSGQAVVVGSGPCGCVAAMYLDRAGFHVTVVQPSHPGNCDGGRPGLACEDEEGAAAFLMPRGVNPLREVNCRLWSPMTWFADNAEHFAIRAIEPPMAQRAAGIMRWFRQSCTLPHSAQLGGHDTRSV